MMHKNSAFRSFFFLVHAASMKSIKLVKFKCLYCFRLWMRYKFVIAFEFTQYNNVSVEFPVERLIAFMGSTYELFTMNHNVDVTRFSSFALWHTIRSLISHSHWILFQFHQHTNPIFVLYTRSWWTLNGCTGQTSQISLAFEIVVTKKQHRKH